MLAAHPKLQTTYEGNFCTCLRTLFSDYSDQSLTRSPERGFSISITLALHLVQPHCASIIKHGQLDTINDIGVAKILDWGGGGQNFVGDQFWMGGKPNITEWGPNLKNN